MNWYYMRGPGGTICCKGNHKAEAVAEAAERWGCGTDEITVTGTEPYNGNGAHCAPLQADRLSALHNKNAAADGKDP